MSADIALVARRFIRASAERVFAAWTEPDHLRQWWGPRPVTCCDASVDLRVGGGYRIGNLLPDGKVVWIAGAFEVVEPPKRLVYSWALDGKDHSRVTVRFEPKGDGTEVIVVHERIADEATRDDHEKGWAGCLDGLERHFLSAQQRKPIE